MKLNNLAAFIALTMSSMLRSSPRYSEAPKSRTCRRPYRGRRGYFVNGVRVYERPAAKWLPNVKGMRYTRDASKGSLVSKLVRR